MKLRLLTLFGWHTIVSVYIVKLMFCCSRQLLIDQGAQVNAKTNLDKTALMDAAARGHSDIVEVSHPNKKQ